jgi:hypothetical protein
MVGNNKERKLCLIEQIQDIGTLLEGRVQLFLGITSTMLFQTIETMEPFHITHNYVL